MLHRVMRSSRILDIAFFLSKLCSESFTYHVFLIGVCADDKGRGTLNDGYSVSIFIKVLGDIMARVAATDYNGLLAFTMRWESSRKLR